MLIAHAIAASEGIAFSRVCLLVCLSVCLSVWRRSKRKMAWAIDTKLCTRILYSSRSTCIDPEVKRHRQMSRSHGYKNRDGRTVASNACCYGHVLLLPAGSACRYDCLCSLVSYVLYDVVLCHLVWHAVFASVLVILILRLSVPICSVRTVGL